jgi:hypothetical protein
MKEEAEERKKERRRRREEEEKKKRRRRTDIAGRAAETIRMEKFSHGKNVGSGYVLDVNNPWKNK